MSFESFGNLMCTDPRNAVPKFVGHDVIKPRCSSWANLISFSMWEAARQSLSKT